MSGKGPDGDARAAFEFKVMRGFGQGELVEVIEGRYEGLPGHLRGDLSGFAFVDVPGMGSVLIEGGTGCKSILCL